jgi:hypothetical protein
MNLLFSLVFVNVVRVRAFVLPSVKTVKTYLRYSSLDALLPISLDNIVLLPVPKEVVYEKDGSEESPIPIYDDHCHPFFDQMFITGRSLGPTTTKTKGKAPTKTPGASEHKFGVMAEGTNRRVNVVHVKGTVVKDTDEEMMEYDDDHCHCFSPRYLYTGCVGIWNK